MPSNDPLQDNPFQDDPFFDPARRRLGGEQPINPGFPFVDPAALPDNARRPFDRGEQHPAFDALARLSLQERIFAAQALGDNLYARFLNPESSVVTYAGKRLTEALTPDWLYEPTQEFKIPDPNDPWYQQAQDAAGFTVLGTAMATAQMFSELGNFVTGGLIPEIEYARPPLHLYDHETSIHTDSLEWELDVRDYIIHPKYIKEVDAPGAPGRTVKVVNQDSLPTDINVRRLFNDNVGSDRDALEFFQQLTGEEWLSNIYRVNNPGVLDHVSAVFRGMILDGSFAAEDLILFGVYKVGNTFMKIGKSGLRAMNASETAHVANLARRGGRVSDGVVELETMAPLAGQSRFARFGQDFARSFGETRGFAGSGPGGKFTTADQIFTAGLFTGVDQVRWNKYQTSRNLIVEQEQMGRYIAWSAAGGLLGASIIRWGVNSRLSNRQQNSVIREVEQSVERHRGELMEAREILHPLALTEADHMALSNRALDEMAGDLWSGLDPLSKSKLAAFFSKIMPSMEATAARHDLYSLRRITMQIADSTANPDYLTQGGSSHSAAHASKMANEGMANNVYELVVRSEGPRINPDRAAHVDDMSRITGLLAMQKEPISELTPFLSKMAESVGWSVSESQTKAMLKGVEILRTVAKETNLGLVETGAINRNFLDFNENHFIRRWMGSQIHRRSMSGGRQDSAGRAQWATDGSDDWLWLLRDWDIKQQLSRLTTERELDIPLTPRDLSPEELLRMQIDAENVALSTTASMMSVDTKSGTSMSPNSVSSYNNRALSIPNTHSFEMTRPDGSKDIINTFEFYDTHPKTMLKHYSDNITPKLISAKKNIEPVVPELLAEAARLLNEGKFAAAHNLVTVAEVTEILSKIGKGNQVEALRNTAQGINQLAGKHSEALGDLAAFENIFAERGIRRDPRTDSYKSAELLLLDLVEGRTGPGRGTVIAEHLNKRINWLLDQVNESQYGKTYEGFETIPIGPTHSSLYSLYEQGSLSNDGFRLAVSHPIIVNRKSLFTRRGRGDWENNNSTATHGDYKRRSQYRVEEEIQDLPEGAVGFPEPPPPIFPSNKPPGPQAQAAGLPVNRSELLKARRVRGKTNADGKATWTKRELLALREASHVLWNSLTKAEQLEFTTLLSKDVNEFLLTYSGLGHTTPNKAGSVSEVFMEAVVRSTAGDESFSDLAGLVTNVEDFVGHVQKYSKGFLSKESKGFLGPRRGVFDKDRAIAPQKRIDELTNELTVLHFETREALRNRNPVLMETSIRGIMDLVNRIGGGGFRNMNRQQLMEIRAGASQHVAQTIDLLLEQSGALANYEGQLDSLRSYLKSANNWIEDSTRNRITRDHVKEASKFRQPLEEFVGEFDVAQLKDFNRFGVKGRIVKAGRTQYERAFNMVWHKYHLLNEMAAKYPKDHSGMKQIIKDVDNLISRFHGISPGATLPHTIGETVVREGLKTTYGALGDALAITQLHDVIGPLYVLGLKNGINEYLLKGVTKTPLIAPVTPPPAGAVSAAYGKVTGAVTKAQEVIGNLVIATHEQDYFGMNTAARELGTDPRVLAGDFERLSQMSSLGIELGNIAGLPPPGKWLKTNQSHFATEINELMPSSEKPFGPKGQKVVGAIEKVADAGVRLTMHQLVSRLRLAARITADRLIPQHVMDVAKLLDDPFHHAAVQLSLGKSQIATLETFIKPRHLKDVRVARAMLGLNDQQARALEVLVDLGTPKDILRKLNNFHNSRLGRGHLILRSVGFNDIEIQQMAQELAKVGGDWAKLPLIKRIRMRNAVEQLTNNMTILPTLTNAAESTNVYFNLLLTFTRFSRAAPTRYLPNLLKHNGMAEAFAVYTASMIWGYVVEGHLRPALLGKDPWDGFNKSIEDWTAKDFKVLLRIMQNLAQFGVYPEIIQGFFGGHPLLGVPASDRLTRHRSSIEKGVGGLYDSWSEEDKAKFAEGAAELMAGVGGMIGFGLMDYGLRYLRNKQEDGNGDYRDAFMPEHYKDPDRAKSGYYLPL